MMGYVYICHHPYKSRYRCSCGERRALMCPWCCSLDLFVLDVWPCEECGTTIKYRLFDEAPPEEIKASKVVRLYYTYGGRPTTPDDIEWGPGYTLSIGRQRNNASD